MAASTIGLQDAPGGGQDTPGRRSRAAAAPPARIAASTLPRRCSGTGRKSPALKPAKLNDQRGPASPMHDELAASRGHFGCRPHELYGVHVSSTQSVFLAPPQQTHLATVGEVTELRLPEHQRVGVLQRIAQFVAEDAELRQRTAASERLSCQTQWDDYAVLDSTCNNALPCCATRRTCWRR